jgi:hypothetical protein
MSSWSDTISFEFSSSAINSKKIIKWSIFGTARVVHNRNCGIENFNVTYLDKENRFFVFQIYHSTQNSMYYHSPVAVFHYNNSFASYQVNSEEGKKHFDLVIFFSWHSTHVRCFASAQNLRRKSWRGTTTRSYHFQPRSASSGRHRRVVHIRRVVHNWYPYLNCSRRVRNSYCSYYVAVNYEHTVSITGRSRWSR